LLATHVVVMNHGRLITAGPLADVLGGAASLEDAYLALIEGSDRAAR
jgi:ABC-type branched-subunit amino acid transport system ATPase component